MSEEHKQHLQCQTCFDDFSTNQELIYHVEEYRYREKLLVAELERCRLHSACALSLHDGADGDGDSDYDNNEEPVNELCCPFRCHRKTPYTTKTNLVRHCQSHISCFEICPFCFQTLTRVHQFIRHECGGARSPSKEVYVLRRITYLINLVNEKVNRLQNPRRKGTKRKSSKSTGRMLQTKVRAKIIEKVAPSADINAANSDDSGISEWDEPGRPVYHHTEERTHAGVESAPSHAAPQPMAVYGNLVSLDEIMENTASNSIDTTIPSKTSIPLNDSGWAFAETTTYMPTNDSGWAFAETAVSADDNKFTFVRPSAIVTDEVNLLTPALISVQNSNAVFVDHDQPAVAETATADKTNSEYLNLAVDAEYKGATFFAPSMVHPLHESYDIQSIGAMGNGSWHSGDLYYEENVQLLSSDVSGLLDG